MFKNSYSLNENYLSLVVYLIKVKTSNQNFIINKFKHNHVEV